MHINIVKVILLLVACYCLYLCVLFFLQRNLLFPGQQYTFDELPAQERSTFITIPLSTTQGPVEAWFLPAYGKKNNHPSGVVIFAHGNGEIIDQWVDVLEPYRAMGLHVCLIEYPGYGRSQGSPSEKTITDVFIKGYDWLATNPVVDTERIIGHGRSVGGGVICQLARMRSLSALILESTFTSLKPFAKYYGAPSCLIRDPFTTIDIVTSFKKPLLLFHGTYDRVVPYQHSVKLKQHAPHAELVTYACGHNSLPRDNEYWKHIREFLQKNSLLTTA